MSASLIHIDFDFRPSEQQRGKLTRQRISPEESNDGCAPVRLFTVSELLNKEECTHIRNAAESAGFQSLDAEYPPEYRNNKRVILRSGVLAETLWQRIVESRAFTKGDLDGSDIRAFGYGAEYSAWKPIGVNNCFKISKYETGAKFVAHRDGTFAANETTVTVLTLLIYLNDDFTGGETNFYTERLQNNGSDNNGNTETETAALKPQYDRNDVFFTATPKMGAALIFNHDALHEGLPVLSNVKFVMRAEIVYQRITTSDSPLPSVTDQSYATMKNLTSTSIPGMHTRAIELFFLADQSEREGRAEEATAYFVEALELQVRHSRSIRSSLNKNLTQLSEDTFALILSYLDYKDIVLGVSATCKQINYWCYERRVWKELYFRHFDSLLPQRVNVNVMVIGSDTLESVNSDMLGECFSNEENEESTLKREWQSFNWYRAFKTRGQLKYNQKKPVLVINIETDCVQMGIAGDDTARVREYPLVFEDKGCRWFTRGRPLRYGTDALYVEGYVNPFARTQLVNQKLRYSYNWSEDEALDHFYAFVQKMAENPAIGPSNMDYAAVVVAMPHKQDDEFVNNQLTLKLEHLSAELCAPVYCIPNTVAAFLSLQVDGLRVSPSQSIDATVLPDGFFVDSVLSSIAMRPTELLKTPLPVNDALILDFGSGDRSLIAPFIAGELYHEGIVVVKAGAGKIRTSINMHLMGDERSSYLTPGKLPESAILDIILRQLCIVKPATAAMSTTDSQTAQQQRYTQHCKELEQRVVHFLGLTEVDAALLASLSPLAAAHTVREWCTQDKYRVSLNEYLQKRMNYFLDPKITDDGQMVFKKKHYIDCPEALMIPLRESLQMVEMLRTHPTLQRNIYITGELALLPGLADRVHNEVAMALGYEPNSDHVCVRVAPRDVNSAFFGASVVAAALAARLQTQ